jgi:FtsP/CotA-like multicopper oxidase with cupredoxin domain
MKKEIHMKKANRQNMVGGGAPHDDSKHEAGLTDNLPPASKWHSIRRPVGVIAVIGVVLGIAFVAFSYFGRVTGAHPLESSESSPQLGSPPFANPSEIRYRTGEKIGRLRGVMELTAGNYMIPNVGTATLRQLRGWDPKDPAPPPKTEIGPGPTLRARVGDLVEISFLNKIDDSLFPYTFVTDSPGGLSDFGCDKSGVRAPEATPNPNPAGTPDPRAGKVNPYPSDDKFPNCFHGSSTANIHYHGTHTDPDGLGDNVLVQVLPQPNQPDWTATFNSIFDSGKIPQKWSEMPRDYRDKQMDLIQKHDEAAAAAAKKNGLKPPESLYHADMEAINAGQWPQYLVGAFPNFFPLPDYKSGNWQAGQAPGTHWYHTHKHGSTSLHILNGLAGAFIIESTQPDGYDQVIRGFYKWGDNYGNHEKIIVFQEFDTTQNLEKPKNPGGGGPPGQGKGIKQVLVNGKLTPTITMAPGEVQLWRMVNATDGNNPGKLTNDLFQTAGFTFKQTAADGVQFSPDNYKNQPFLTAGQVPGGLALAAGNRADVLVQAPTKPGNYTFVTGKTSRNPTGTTLYFVNVTGTPDPPSGGAFPQNWPPMPPFLQDLRKPGPYDVTNPGSPVKFQWEALRNGTGLNAFGFPPHFMINGKQFGETGEIVDQCMPLNGLQDWVLENWTNTPHPFHIHINPFQVIKIEIPVLIDTSKPVSAGNIKYTTYTPPCTLACPSCKPVCNYVWQDVITMPPGQITTDGKTIFQSKVTIRQTYLDFDGTYVLHCHILAHEDRGMMQLVRVVPAAGYPGNCQGFIPEHH